MFIAAIVESSTECTPKIFRHVGGERLGTNASGDVGYTCRFYVNISVMCVFSWTSNFLHVIQLLIGCEMELFLV